MFLVLHQHFQIFLVQYSGFYKTNIHLCTVLIIKALQTFYKQF